MLQCSFLLCLGTPHQMHEDFRAMSRDEVCNSPHPFIGHSRFDLVCPLGCRLPTTWMRGVHEHESCALSGGASICIGNEKHALETAACNAIADGVDARIAWMDESTSWPNSVWLQAQPCLDGCSWLVAMPGPHVQCTPLFEIPRARRGTRWEGGPDPRPQRVQVGWTQQACTWWRCCEDVQNVCQCELHVAVLLLHVDQANIPIRREIEKQASKR